MGRTEYDNDPTAPVANTFIPAGNLLVVDEARAVLRINDPDASYQELGADWHQRHLNAARKTHDLVRQLHALGHQVTLEPVTA